MARRARRRSASTGAVLGALVVIAAVVFLALRGTGVTLHDVAPSVPVPLLGLPLISADAVTRRDLAAPS